MTLTFSKETKTAFLFPGQGAQVVGMGLDLFKNSKAAKNVFEEVDDALGKSLSKLIFEGHPDEKNSSFCGRTTVDKFSYCPLHLMIIFQPKSKKDDIVDKDDDVPKFIEKKIKSA